MRHIVTPADLAGSLRDRTNRQLDNGEISTIDAHYFFQLADLCEQKNVWPASPVRQYNWFGFGPVEILLNNHDDEGFWISLIDAAQVSGMTHDAIRAMFEEDQADGYTDMVDLEWLVNDDGDRNVIALVQHSFVIRAMLAGPWAKEYMDNTMGLFRRALVNSGLGDKLGPVLVVKDGVATQTHMTFTEFMSEGEQLPSERDAVEQAMRGPGGAL